MVASRPMHAEASHSLLSVAIGGLPGQPRAVIDALAASGWRGVQLDARMAGMRPHELGESARRDLMGLLSRRQLTLTGIDLWLPESAFSDPSTQERAVDRTIDCIRLASALGASSISTVLPEPGLHPDLQPAIDAVLVEAESNGIRVADCSVGAHAAPTMRPYVHALCLDPASLLTSGGDPIAAIHEWGDRLAAARLDDVSPNGLRIPPSIGGGGRLDLMAYKVAMSLATPDIGGVVVDLRQCAQPLLALQQARSAWESIS